MSDLDLKEISRLCEAATPGPWKTWPDGTEESVESESLGRFVCHLNSNMRDYREDSAFIAASRTLVPALSAEVKRLREQVRIATATLEYIRQLQDEKSERLEFAGTYADDGLIQMSVVE